MNGFHIHVHEGEIEGARFAIINAEGKGCARLRFGADVTQMADFHVQENYRRQGIGTVLYQSALELARAHDSVSLAFLVDRRNHNAIAFYRKMGAAAYMADAKDWWMAHIIRPPGEDLLAGVLQRKERA
jgi:GNAT superfamily N-acetyltransferase